MGAKCSSKKFSMFEFDYDDPVIKSSAKKSKKKSRSDDTPLTKYNFLQHFTRGTKTQHKNFSNEPPVVDVVDEAVEERVAQSDAASQSSYSNYNTETYSRPKYRGTGTSLNVATGQKNLDSAPTHFLSDNEPVPINSDEDDDNKLSPKKYSCDLAGPLREHMLEHDIAGCDLESTVFVSPKYVVYDGARYWNPKLTFSSSSIKLDVSDVRGNKGPLIFEWKTADFVNIESRRSDRFEAAKVCLHLKSEHTKVADDARNSGILELKFEVSDPQWARREEAIKSLIVRDKDKRDISFDFFESFEDVTYPKGDPDSVTICKRDIDLLQPETFINDTIIDFYIKYLKNKVERNDMDRFHFFNSFFFRKLDALFKERSRACEGRTAFQHVRKWTRKVDIFQKDYIFIPVNFSLHWSLIIICHPGEVVNFRDEEMENSLKVPCILHMDSIKGSHRGLKKFIKSYLWEEWKERSTDPAENISSNFLNLRFISLELPQQQNSFDCGLFLLHYMERFVEQAPVNFNPLRTAKSSTFLNKDWFPPAEASRKRTHIKKLIYEIAEHNFQQVPLSACNDKCSFKFSDVKEEESNVEFLHETRNSRETCHESYSDVDAYRATDVMSLTENPLSIVPHVCSSELTVTNEKETDIKLFREAYNSNEACHGNYPYYSADESISVISMAAKPLRSVPYLEESESVSEGCSGPEDNGGSPIDGNDQPFGQMILHNQFKIVMPPIEEGEETSDKIACLPIEEAHDQQLAVITEPSVTNINANETRWRSEILLDPEEFQKKNQSGTSIDWSPISSEEPMKEQCLWEEVLESNPEKDEDVYQCSSTSSDEIEAFCIEDSQEDEGVHERSPTSDDDLEDCVVKDSQEDTGELDVSVCENSPCVRRLFASSKLKGNSSIEVTFAANCKQPLLDLEEVQVSKRPRLMLPETGKRVSRSLSKDLQEIVLCE